MSLTILPSHDTYNLLFPCSLPVTKPLRFPMISTRHNIPNTRRTLVKGTPDPIGNRQDGGNDALKAKRKDR